MKKLTKKSLVLSAISLLAACLLFLVAFCGATGMLPFGSEYLYTSVLIGGSTDLGRFNLFVSWSDASVAWYVFMFLFLSWATLLLALNLLALLFGDKLRTTVHFITLITVLLTTAILLLFVFLIAMSGAVQFFNRYEGINDFTKYYIRCVCYYLFLLEIYFIPLFLSAVNLIVYCILLKKFPKTKHTEQIEAPVSANEGLESERVEY